MCTGYARDSSAVAREAVKHAAEEGYDCVLIDTAGRMQVRTCRRLAAYRVYLE